MGRALVCAITLAGRPCSLRSRRRYLTKYDVDGQGWAWHESPATLRLEYGNDLLLAILVAIGMVLHHEPLACFCSAYLYQNTLATRTGKPLSWQSHVTVRVTVKPFKCTSNSIRSMSSPLQRLCEGLIALVRSSLAQGFDTRRAPLI